MLKIRIYLDINIFNCYNCVKDKNLIDAVEVCFCLVASIVKVGLTVIMVFEVFISKIQMAFFV